MTAVVSLQPALAAIFGLLIGSFLNVVIYRLPKMLEREWNADHEQHARDAGWLPEADPPTNTKPEVFNLLQPRSRCPSCGHMVRWYENIPVLSYLALRGRCSGCSTSISLRYPLVEAATGALFYVCALQGGGALVTLAWCGFCAALLSLALIDWDTTFLPDNITLPLLWAGLLASAFGWTGITATQAIVGAAAGYLWLWTVYWVFKLITGREGMGYGDFKLLAALGAWLGGQALVPVILMASVIGIIVAIVMKCHKRLREGNQYIPFGPFLAGGGIAAMLWGPEHIMKSLLSLAGL